MSVQTAPAPTPPSAGFEALVPGFRATHRNAANIIAHFITTSLGITGALALLGMLHPILPSVVGLVYLLAMIERLRRPVLVGTVALTIATVGAATVWPLAWWWAVGAIVLGYVGQDVAHWLSNESTFQSTYSSERGLAAKLAEHTVYLFPLLVDAWLSCDEPFSPLVPADRIAHGKVSGARERAAIATIHEWVTAQDVPVETTTHWWRHALPEPVAEAYRVLAESEQVVGTIQARFGSAYTVLPVVAMDEVYMAASCPRMTSDTVFYMSHVDGPFSMWPLSSVYRCLVAITPNERVSTHFPMDGMHYGEPRSYTMDQGDVLGFDFNRELHYITEDPDVELPERRVSLKVHYAVVPKAVAWWGRLHGAATAQYNILARRAFLDTIAPSSLRARAGAAWILATTKTAEVVQRYAGASNLFYVAVAGAIAAAAGSLELFILLTGFVHYILYITVFAQRRNISYGTWVRDALFFKVVSTVPLFAVYAATLSPDPVSIGLVVAGFGLSAWSTHVLGIQRTYFGVELGRVSPVRIDRFPYGYLPHPMILGSVLGLLGLHASAGFREALPWVVPLHVLLYAVHTIQEELDTRRRLAELQSVDGGQAGQDG